MYVHSPSVSVQLDEVTVDDEESKQMSELNERVKLESEKVASMKDENIVLQRNLLTNREELETWKSKLERIDDEDLYQFSDEQRNAILIETRRLKNLNTNIKKRIREIQK
ncbi:unnamed protein product, partial [Anisakis simplex]|uniref:ERM domain-containing protein n=1 Tax=Anisakis simplex TaxID=6269 RepID=A0A0M3JHS6_ANISI